MRLRTVLALAVLTLLLSGCAHKKKQVRIPPVPQIGDTETGIASWYGHPYHGRPAADGEIYDMEKMTAAHRTLPFNTWVRVYDLDNNKTVDVRIIDRGPFVNGRIIDLSHAAARAIDMIGPGMAHVRLEIIHSPEPAPAAAAAVFAVQVGAFRNRGNAERLRTRMENRYGVARLVPRAGDSFWRVLVGSEPTQDAAQALASRIQQESDEKNPDFVVRVDSD
ncbi:MAG TPA: septal ring lytic transglycosylase RlpA family protein [Bryobacteraceae bacterium]|nr:septal ring lytic transglycosylase RlpA family protein [Bryobacteraceae bacterium]